MILYWEGHIIQGRPEEITEFIKLNTPCRITTSTSSNWPQVNTEELRNKSINDCVEVLKGLDK